MSRLTRRAKGATTVSDKGGVISEVMDVNGSQVRTPNSGTVNPRPQHSIAGDTPMHTGTRGLANIRFTMNNTGGTTRPFVVGSPNAEALSGLVMQQPTSGSNVVAAIQASFQWAPVQVEQIIIRTSTNPAQFDEEFLYHSGVDVNQSKKAVGSVPLSLTANPINQSQLIIRLDFAEEDGIILNWQSFIEASILANEVVTMTLVPLIAWNRVA